MLIAFIPYVSVVASVCVVSDIMVNKHTQLAAVSVACQLYTKATTLCCFCVVLRLHNLH